MACSRNFGATSMSRVRLLVSAAARVGCAAGGGRRDLLAPRPPAARCAELLEHLNLRAIALVDRPVERPLTLGGLGVRVGAFLEQQLQGVGALGFRRDGVHERRPRVLGRQARVHICSSLDPAGHEIHGLPGRGGTQQILGGTRCLRQQCTRRSANRCERGPLAARLASALSDPDRFSTRKRTTSTSADRTASASAVAPALSCARRSAPRSRSRRSTSTLRG